VYFTIQFFRRVLDETFVDVFFDVAGSGKWG
jgi:hypothetical protein